MRTFESPETRVRDSHRHSGAGASGDDSHRCYLGKFGPRGRGRRSAMGWVAYAVLLTVAACFASVPTAMAQNDFYGISEDIVQPPTITWLSPPKGHISGGTVLTIYGSGFKRSRVAKVRFATESQFDEVDAEYVSESMIRCVTPKRATPDTAHITVANDGMQFSGWPLVYTKGSGTFLKFIFDNSRPGCLDCLNSAVPLSGGRVYAGLNPSKVVERWVLDNATGPYIGGTLVTITAAGLEWTRAGVAEYDMYIPGTTQRYNGPVGGPGTPHPHNVDPMSSGNGPPVTGTFYPSEHLMCMWQCYFDFDQNAGTGENLTAAGLPAGVDEITESDWVPATWIDYTKISCESPPHKVPGRSNEEIAPTTCRVRVTNDGEKFHEGSYAVWRYEDKRPTVTNIKTNQFSVWPARGPFAGNTEVVVTGTNFLPSKYLKCRFGGVNTADTGGAYEQDDVSHIVGEVGGRVRYISSTEIICVTPIFGPAAAASQYPAGSPGTIGSGAELVVDGYGGESSFLTYPYSMKLLDGTVVMTNRSDSVGNITVVSGGKGYATAPTITLEGGGGCCYNITCAVDDHGTITSVTVHDGGRGYNQGADAAATATISTVADGDPGSDKRQIVHDVKVTEGGSGYLVPPDVYFECSGGPDDRSCFSSGEDSDGGPVPSWVPGEHATAIAVLGEYDPKCDNSWQPCDAQGAVVRVDITFPGRYYSSAPVVKFRPQTPKVIVTPNERILDFADPPKVGYYSNQGKGWDELDPEQSHGSWTNGQEDTSIPYDVTGMPNGQNRLPGVSASQNCATPGFCPEARNPEDRGPLLPPLGKAWMDGSIKPGHQELVRVSNNYHKFGAMRGNDQDQVRTHFGYRNQTKNASIGEDMGYWMWSNSGMTEAEMNRCRVSNNPPIHQFSSLQGHGLDAALGLGTADDEFQLIGPTNNLRYLDGSSVGGAPGYGAAAMVTLSANDTVCASTKKCYVSHVTVTNGGKGYMYPPTVTFSGSSGYGAKATAVISGGIVVRIEVDPLARGIGYESATLTEVHITAVRQPTVYDAAAPHEGVYIDKGALTYDDSQTAHYDHALPNGTDGGDPPPRSVGHGTYTIDQSARSVHVGQFASTSNYMVGHGAFPGHPGNQNLGHPRKDCIYFLYSDIYVSPSGSDSTGQGTAGRPYRTLQKCIDASLAGSRDYYVYKRADGGDRDPAIPDGTPRYGIESAGERVDATKAGMNTGTGRDKGYTGRQVRNYNERRTGWREATTGRLYGGRSWSDNTRDTQKGFGYTVNRDRCVLKDGVYWGEGNRELQPHGHMVEIWAENAQNVIIDCGGRGVGKNVFTADRHSGERASVLGSVTMHGVVMRRCTVRADPKANHRPYYPGRPGYGPGAKNPNGQSCWPGATGCQYRQAVDGQAAGQ